MQSDKITANITKLDASGKMTIEFNTPLYVPMNISEINENVMSLKIKAG